MNCTEPASELVTFWLAGSLAPAEAALVASHLETCGECRAAAREGLALVKGLRELHLDAGEIVAAAAGDLQAPHLLACSSCRDEVALLRSVNADLMRTPGRSRWVGWAAAAAVVVAVPLLWLAVRPRADTPPLAFRVAAGDTPSPVAPPRLLRVEKASLAALASEAVLLRGTRSPRRALLDDLAVALEPYRRDDFEEAAKRLRALGPKYPEASEIPYYLGVCLLLLDRPAEAVAPLEIAARRMTPPDEANRYLDIARANAAAERRP